MDPKDITEDVLEGLQVVTGPDQKLNSKVFVQIQSLWPKDKTGTPIKEADEIVKELIESSLIDELQIIGFVYCVRELGSVGQAYPGFWIVTKYEGQLRKILVAKNQESFQKNLKLIPDWENIKQIFL